MQKNIPRRRTRRAKLVKPINTKRLMLLLVACRDVGIKHRRVSRRTKVESTVKKSVACRGDRKQHPPRVASGQFVGAITLDRRVTRRR